MSNNINLCTAKSEKNDEFYTRYEDIEKEVMNYKEQFENKVVLCNCDDPEWSNFWKFFHQNFSLFKLKKLVSTHYVESGSSYAQVFDGARDEKIPLARDEQSANAGDYNLFELCSPEVDGDFRSKECIEYLEEADIVVTNPPFSLFREFITTLEKYNKKYLVLGNQNAIVYKDIFPLIKDNRIWTGINNGEMAFRVPADSEAKETRFWIDEDGQKWRSLGNAMWFTNLDNERRHELIPLHRKYNEKDYPEYDNYNAINVDKLTDIPCDYYGAMGVPITFIDKHNPEQFEIIGLSEQSGRGYSNGLLFDDSIGSACFVKGKKLYSRLFIRRVAK